MGIIYKYEGFKVLYFLWVSFGVLFAHYLVVLFVGTICGYAYQMEKGEAGLDKLERSPKIRGELEKIC